MAFQGAIRTPLVLRVGPHGSHQLGTTEGLGLPTPKNSLLKTSHLSASSHRQKHLLSFIPVTNSSTGRGAVCQLSKTIFRAAATVSDIASGTGVEVDRGKQREQREETEIHILSSSVFCSPLLPGTSCVIPANCFNFSRINFLGSTAWVAEGSVELLDLSSPSSVPSASVPAASANQPLSYLHRSPLSSVPSASVPCYGLPQRETTDSEFKFRNLY